MNKISTRFNPVWLLLGILLVKVPGELHGEPRWPRFRGAQADGRSRDTNVPGRWNPEDVAWRTELDGAGHSSPCLWDGKIFLTSARKDDNGRVERLVHCLDGRDGRVLWQEVAAKSAPVKNHPMNSEATPTCATDGERVIAFFGPAGIHCYDFAGKKLWSRDLGGFPGPWGTASSPIISGDLVIQNCDRQGDSCLVALDKRSGKVVWETARRPKPRGGWSTPVVIETDSGRELVVNGEFGVTGYDPGTGRELWFCKGFKGRGTPTPLFADGILYVISAKTGDTFALRPGGRGDVTASHMLWHTPRPAGRNLASPVIEGDRLLTVSMEGRAYCYDPESGRQLWAELLKGRYTASPLVAGGRFFLLSESGRTLVIKPDEQLNILAANELGAGDGEVFRSALIPSEGRIFTRSDRAVYCIAPK